MIEKLWVKLRIFEIFENFENFEKFENLKIKFDNLIFIEFFKND